MRRLFAIVIATLRKLLNLLRGTARPTAVQGFLRPIDTAAIARELDLLSEATERGKLDQPSANTTTLDSVEQRIIQRVESEWTWQGGELINQLRAYATRLVGYSVQSEFVKLHIKAENALARLRNAHHQAEAILGPLRETYVAQRDELAEFRRKHKLTRPARNPEKRWSTFGLLFVLVAVESGLNGVIFAKGSQFGLIGGIGTAIGISFANVVLAFLVGLFPARWVHHRNIIVKFTGVLLVLSGLTALLSLHAFAAFFRDAVVAVGDDEGMTLAVKHMFTWPWTFADIATIYLFALGTLFAFGAFWKGYTFDDPYPGYGYLYRRQIGAQQAYSEEHAVLFDDLEEIKEDTINALESGITTIPLFPQEAANIRAKRSALVQGFSAYESAVETAVNQLLALYRDNNRKYRNSPVPPHFERSWSVPHTFLNSAAVKTLLTEADEQAPGVNQTLAELRQLSEKVLSEYEKLIRDYPHPTRM
jgi:hypothetical protein